MLRLRLVQAEGRRLDLDEDEQDRRQAHQTAEIAQAPRPTGDAAEPALGRQSRQHGIVEDHADFEGDHGDADQPQHQDRVASLRVNEPQHRRAGDYRQRAGGEPDIAAAAVVGDRAQQRAGQGDQQRRRALHRAPLRCADGRAVSDGLGEIGGEDKGRHHGGKGRVGPVVEAPGDDRPARDRRFGMVRG